MLLLFLANQSISFGQQSLTFPGTPFGFSGSTNVCTSNPVPQTYKIEGDLVDLNLPTFFDKVTDHTFKWKVTNGTVLYQAPGYNSNTRYEGQATIRWDELCETGTIKAILELSFIDAAGGEYLFIYTSEYNVRLTMKTDIPPPITIGGSKLIECETTPTVEYDVTTSDCLNTYKWTLPPSWRHNNIPLVTKKILAYPDLTEGGTITLELSNTTDNGGCENKVTETITVLRKCPLFEEYTTPTSNLPPHTATEDYILVDPSSSYAEVVSGQEVRFKAGKSIHLRPNFKVYPGAYFKAKIGNCLSCQAYKIANNNNSNNSNNIAQTAAIATDLTVHPNPTTGVFDLYFQDKVDFRSEDVITIEIYSINGQLVQRTLEQGKEHYSLDISELPSSLYLIKLLDPSGNIYNTKIIKQ